MTTLAVMVLTGMTMGLGLYVVYLALRPATQPRLDHALDRLSPDQLRQATGAAPSVLHPTTPVQRFGALIERHLVGRGGLSTPTAELDLLGRTSHEFWAEKMILGLLGLFTPLMVTTMMQMLGVGLPLVVPALAGPALAVVFFLLPDNAIRAKAARARREFVQAVVAYLQLAAIQRSSSGAHESLWAAAQVGQSWPFVRIRQELTRARWARVQPWDALVELGERTRIPEIAEVGDIMRLAADTNAGVTANLTARAAGVQNRLLNEEWKRANEATTAMALPVVGIVVVLVGALMLPLAQQLLA